MNKRQLTKLCGLVLVCALSVSLCGCNSIDYKKAESLMEDNNVQDALVLYQGLEEEGGYKDSADKVKECTYILAANAFETMDYNKAYELYSSLGDYKDSDDLKKKAGYALANLFAANDNYQNAYLLFSELGDYEQSIDLASKCVSYMFENAVVGDSVFYGHYEQDGITDNGSEPIQWVVMASDGSSVLLLSEYILEKKAFDSYSHYWEESDLRDWLNSSFFNNAFSEDERNTIQKMITSENTSDYVFCLSAEEARGLFSDDESRRACPTELLLVNGFKAWEECGDWWTRSISTASNGKGVVPVEADGNVRSAGTVPYDWDAYTDIGVRPAICISLTGTVTQAQNMSRFGFDSNTDLDHEPNLWKGSNNSSSGSSSGKCIVCNGTGYVKYYYGSSDLEAWLTGHDAYTVGECTSCKGTGKAN